MRFGLSSWSCPWQIGVPGFPPARPMDAEALLDLAIEYRVEALQIADNLPLHELSTKSIDRLSGRAQSHGVVIELGTRGIDNAALAPYLDLAERIGAPILRTLLHGVPPCEARPLIEAVLPRLEAIGCTLAIENHDSYPSAELARLVGKIAHPRVGVCLDPVNGFGNGESALEVFENLAACTVCFHLKDYTIRRVPHMLGMEIVGAPAGEGMLDIPASLGRLPRAESAVLELWTPWQGGLDATIELEREWVARSISILRRLQSAVKQS